MRSYNIRYATGNKEIVVVKITTIRCLIEWDGRGAKSISFTVSNANNARLPTKWILHTVHVNVIIFTAAKKVIFSLIEC